MSATCNGKQLSSLKTSYRGADCREVASLNKMTLWHPWVQCSSLAKLLLLRLVDCRLSSISTNRYTSCPLLGAHANVGCRPVYVLYLCSFIQNNSGRSWYCNQAFCDAVEQLCSVWCNGLNPVLVIIGSTLTRKCQDRVSTIWLECELGEQCKS